MERADSARVILVVDFRLIGAEDEHTEPTRWEKMKEGVDRISSLRRWVWQGVQTMQRRPP